MSKVSLALSPKKIELQQYSNNADSVTFYFDRYINDRIDLSTMTSKIVLDSKNIIISGLNKTLIQEYSVTKIKITWNFDEIATAKLGEHNFQIIFTDKDDIVQLYSDVGKLKINKSLNVSEIENVVFFENLSLFKQWEERMESLSRDYYIPKLEENILSWIPSNNILPKIDDYEIKKTTNEITEGFVIEKIGKLAIIYLNGYNIIDQTVLVPSNLCPSTQIYASVCVENVGNGFISIDTSGNIKLYNNNLGSNITGKIFGTISYFTI
jgi:hypothetical protein